MKLFCIKNPDKEIKTPNICTSRQKNKNLPECCGCPGPSPRRQDVIEQKVVGLLDEQEPVDPGHVFRLKNNKDRLVKKYGYKFYRDCGGV